MDAINLQAGVEKALDAIFADRLALLCGAGLSMAAPSSVPSAAALAWKAKQKYDATHGAARAPLADSIDDQAEFFFQRGELADVYLKTYIDHDAFAGVPNDGHFAAADLLLTGGIGTAVSTNVDSLIEAAGNLLFGHVGAGVSRDKVAALPANRSPLLKIHGCWSDPAGTVWAAGQVAAEPIHTRLAEDAAWLTQRLLDRDLVTLGRSKQRQRPCSISVRERRVGFSTSGNPARSSSTSYGSSSQGRCCGESCIRVWPALRRKLARHRTQLGWNLRRRMPKRSGASDAILKGRCPMNPQKGTSLSRSRFWE
jgi:hypothetical protein